MAIVKWQPFGEFDRFLDEFDTPAFGRVGGDMAIDLYEDENAIVAELNLPAVDPEKIDVTVEGQYLRVVGTREEEKEKKNKQFYSKEIRRGSFERAVRLPAPVNENDVKAEYTSGVLKVTMPKLEEKKSGKVKVVVKK